MEAPEYHHQSRPFKTRIVRRTEQYSIEEIQCINELYEEENKGGDRGERETHQIPYLP